MYQSPIQPVQPACPNCWHHPEVNEKDGGLSTFSIALLINFKGGLLDRNNKCNKCNWNYNLELRCTDCNPQLPCHKHYATIHNGMLRANMPLEMHRIYMRNSPYNTYWDNRPASIGTWYAKQVTTYKSAITFAKRFTTNREAINALNDLEKSCYHHYDKFNTFWPGFYVICSRYFSSTDPISLAMKSYYHTLRSIDCK